MISFNRLICVRWCISFPVNMSVASIAETRIPLKVFFSCNRNCNLNIHLVIGGAENINIQVKLFYSPARILSCLSTLLIAAMWHGVSNKPNLPKQYVHSSLHRRPGWMLNELAFSGITSDLAAAPSSVAAVSPSEVCSLLPSKIKYF